MRPRTLEAFLGQRHLLGDGASLRRAVERDDFGSIVLWGPPGCGKTTLARIIASNTRAPFLPFSAVMSGIKEVRAVMQDAERLHRAQGRRTVLFVDEIHRFNKAQQDAFLPHVERGTIVLIGATTENPSFEINSALLSRSRVYRLERLGDDDLAELIRRTLGDAENGVGELSIDCPERLVAELARQGAGDARFVLNVVETLASRLAESPAGARTVDDEMLKDALQAPALRYDKAGEEHFNLISALQKSMRDSDPDATVYWLARMIESGEDPMYVARRIVRFASEDVGLADPQALAVTTSARDALHFLGLPEGALALTQAAIYCATAPKSNALTKAWSAARGAIEQGATDPVPLALRNAPTGAMKAEGYGKGYRYAHDHADAVTDLECLPERLRGRRFYEPTTRGFERELDDRLARRRKARSKLSGDAE
ncbi:MAG: replication-associated recombination protein A [bacterium]|nr:replication-associated recombination protein A [bacterium]